MLGKTNAVALAACSTLTALVALAGCQKEQKPGDEGKGTPAPAPAAEVRITPEARAEAGTIFENRCTPCHGPTGAGDGPTAKTLSPPPRDFRDPAWQSQVTDTHIEEIIRSGGPAVGKSAAMPANPDLIEKPEIVAALREYIRKLKKPQ